MNKVVLVRYTASDTVYIYKYIYTHNCIYTHVYLFFFKLFSHLGC